MPSDKPQQIEIRGMEIMGLTPATGWRALFARFCLDGAAARVIMPLVAWGAVYGNPYGVTPCHGAAGLVYVQGHCTLFPAAYVEKEAATMGLIKPGESMHFIAYLAPWEADNAHDNLIAQHGPVKVGV